MIQALLNLIAPDDCLDCKQEGFIWCDWCRLSSDTLPSRCFKCHAATDNFDTCPICRKHTKIKRLYIAKQYKDTAKSLVTALKYGSKRHAALPIAHTLVDITPCYPADVLVVAVPTAPINVRRRGFDHTKLIAKEFARIKGLSFAPVLAKNNNLHQVGSSKKQRIKQAKQSYRLKMQKSISGKTILLVDDVVTTGSTLNECIDVLNCAGANKVYAAVFAYSS